MTQPERRVPSRRERRRAWISAALLAVEGVTVAIVGFVSFGCDFSDRGEARVVRMAVVQWQAINASSNCPANAELVRTGVLDPGMGRDALADYRIVCSTDEVSVAWAGPDHHFGTSDDVTVPDPLGDPPPLTISRLGSAPLIVLPLALFLSGLAILATLVGLRAAAPARRAAWVVGWFSILVCLGCGTLDALASQVAAMRPALSIADAERCRGRGTRSLLWEGSLGAMAGMPGAFLVPFRVRRRTPRGGVGPSRG